MKEQLAESWNKMLARLETWMDMVITNLPNIVLAGTIFLLAYWLSNKIKYGIERVLKHSIKQASIRSLLASIVAMIVIAMGLFLALGILNLDKVLSSLLAGAGVAGLAIGLALQGTLSNTFSGIFLAVKDIMEVGDFIDTNGYTGTVSEINLRYVKIKEPDNNIVIISNKLVVDNPFKNYGLTARIKTKVHCGVSYDSDLRFVKKIATKAIGDQFEQQGIERVEFSYLSFGDSSIDFQIRFWIDARNNKTLQEAESEAIMILKEVFDEHNIDIPYPIRTVRLDDQQIALLTAVQ